MNRFSTYVVRHDLVADHPDGRQQRKLAEALRNLPDGYALVYCTEARCEFFVRRPLRLDDAGLIAFQHLTYVHWDALIDGRACIDPDLVDGGVAYLADRLRCVPEHVRPTLEELAS